MKTYIKNPLNEKSFDEASKLLYVRAETIGEGKSSKVLFPPFCISYKKLVLEPGSLQADEYNLTGEIRNDYMALPPIMTILWAGMKNLSPREW